MQSANVNLMTRTNPQRQDTPETHTDNTRAPDDSVSVARQLPIAPGGSPLRRSSASRLASPSSIRVPSTGRGGDSRGRVSVGNSTLRLSYEDLSRRPRSNPRQRTPMRHESPLHPNAFRDVSPNPPAHVHREGQRVTVRPLAIATVGTTYPMRRDGAVGNQNRSTTPSKSQKQGPSHRKVRRWNNDNFVGLAAEVAKSGTARSAKAAEEMLKAQATASKYRSVLGPLEDQAQSPSSAFAELCNRDDLKETREKFLSGEIGPRQRNHGGGRRPRISAASLTPNEMIEKIQPRLRDILQRACVNSSDSIRLVDEFEKFLVATYSLDDKVDLERKRLTNLVESMIEEPTISYLKQAQIRVCFYFDPDDTMGGFNRLLLHGVASFHGLNAVASSRRTNATMRRTRVLTITGTLQGPGVIMTNHLIEIPESGVAPNSITDCIPHSEAIATLEETQSKLRTLKV